MSLKVAEQWNDQIRGKGPKKICRSNVKGQRRTEKRGYEWGERSGIILGGMYSSSGHGRYESDRKVPFPCKWQPV